MRLIHLSDLHFGRDISVVSRAVHDYIAQSDCDLVIVSGDFTQTGSLEEFAAAQTFIQGLEKPVLCVPGNHDVPAYNLYKRIFHPFTRYKRYIHEGLNPVYVHDGVKICGINSARGVLPHWNWANGAISFRQRSDLQLFMAGDDDVWRICVLHHPIHKVQDMPMDVTVFGRKRMLSMMDDLKIDIVLTGHMHCPSIVTREGDDMYQGVYVSASTALSDRKRGHENGFNVIDLQNHKAVIKMLVWTGEEFAIHQQYDFIKSGLS